MKLYKFMMLVSLLLLFCFFSASFADDDKHNDDHKKYGDKYKIQNNAAEHASNKKSRKILKSLKGRTPIRVSEIPYFGFTDVISNQGWTSLDISSLISPSRLSIHIKNYSETIKYGPNLVACLKTKVLSTFRGNYCA